MTRTLTLVCGQCARSRVVRGPDAAAIIRQIDISGWRDMPSMDMPRGTVRAVCDDPACQSRWDESLDEEITR